MAPVADGGLEASKRMHEYLLSKQRKQEEYWLRKYGKVLQQPPPSLGRPPANPRLPPLPGGGGSSAGGSGVASSRGSNNGGGLGPEPSAGGGSMLPPLPGAHGPGAASSGPAGLPPHHHRQPKGHAPIFHAQEPVKDFFTRNARQPRAGGAAAAVAASRDELGSALPPSHRPPEPYRRAPPPQLPPMAGGYAQQQLQQRLPNPSEHPHPQQQEYGGSGSTGDGSGYHHSYQSPYQQQSLSPRSARSGHGPSPRAGGSGGGAAPRSLPSLPPEPLSARSPHSGGGVSNAGKPLRNLEMELSVIRAIKAREDVLERLRVAAGKLDSGFGGSAPVVLSPVDPLVRLFYRLVGSLRQRTLDVIEAIAAWRRKVNPADPFIYYGVDYLAAIGPDVGFLDELPFLRTRLTFGRAADDPFLAEVTPDGIPIEEATTCDLRRGGQRFSSDALRIRMARKVLAHYCGRPMPGENPSAYLLEGGSSVGGGGLASEASQPRSARTQDPQEEAEEEAEGEEGGGMTTAQILRALSPPVAPVSSLPPVASVRAITPPAAVASAGGSQAVDVAEDEREEAGELARRSLAAEISEAAPRMGPLEREEEEEAEQQQKEQEEEEQGQAEEEGAAAEAEAEVAAEIAAEAAQDEWEQLPEPQTEPEPAPEPERSGAPEPEPEQPQPQQLPNEADLLIFDDDNDFIDFALGAIIHSLEPQNVAAIPPGTFTVAGWEIDRQLEEVVRGIASPELRPRGSRVAALGSGRIPQPPSAPKPPSAQGRASDAGTTSAPSPPPSRGSRIPAPPSAARPPSNGAAAAAGPAPRPPVRVHLRPGSTGLDMGLSMDAEDLAAVPPQAARPPSGGGAAAAVTASARPPVRVHLRPGSSGVDMGLSMDAEELMAAQGAAGSERPGSSSGGRPGSTGRPGSRGGLGGTATTSAEVGLPAISEDRSAFFGADDGDGEQGEDGTAGAVDGGEARPPVRVHLRPNSREINMAISMDEDGILMASPSTSPSAAAAADAAAPTVAGSALELEEAAALTSAADAGDVDVDEAPLRLSDAAVPVQGSLLSRSNRASLRLSRQGGGSRPGSAASTS